MLTGLLRAPRLQPVEQLYPNGVVEIRGVKPLTETRGIRQYPRIMEALRTMPRLRASPVLAGQAIITFAGKDVAVSLNNLAVLLKNQEKYEEAAALYQRALAIFEAALGSEHPKVVTCRKNYAGLALKLNGR